MTLEDLRPAIENRPAEARAARRARLPAGPAGTSGSVAGGPARHLSPLDRPPPRGTLVGMGSRIVPSHFRADGKPKTAYDSKWVAADEAKRLGMTYYRCDFCNRYHLASKAQR